MRTEEETIGYEIADECRGEVVKSAPVSIQLVIINFLFPLLLNYELAMWRFSYRLTSLTSLTHCERFVIWVHKYFANQNLYTYIQMNKINVKTLS